MIHFLFIFDMCFSFACWCCVCQVTNTPFNFVATSTSRPNSDRSLMFWTAKSCFQKTKKYGWQRGRGGFPNRQSATDATEGAFLESVEVFPPSVVILGLINSLAILLTHHTRINEQDVFFISTFTVCSKETTQSRNPND